MLMDSDLIRRVKETRYWRVPGTTTTVCALIFDNGYVGLGFSSCADDADFDERAGEKFAHEDAVSRTLPVLAWERKQSKMNN